MLALLHNGYLVVSVAVEDTSSHCWSVTVDISGRKPGLTSRSIETRYEFATKEDAEVRGIDQARVWIQTQEQTISRQAS